jgi:adenosylcobinamide kinase / adenosylcobinamide-phosphate guanylyltransferase
MAQRLIFLLGGARSGKSHYAETWARENGKRILYVATAQALDDEMRERIDQHRFQRPAHWQTLDTVVLDCITLLASNILLTLPEDCSQSAANQAVMDEAESILAARHASDATWLIVSNEVGMGLVPPYRLGRLYRDALGYANQRLALAADDVLLFVAGLPWKLK